MQYTNLIWRDGQPYSEMFDDIYYSSAENEGIPGEHEFNHVFFNNNGLPQRWTEGGDFIIAELGFGSGLNCILTIREWLKQSDDKAKHRCLHYIAFEKYPLSPEAITELLSRYPQLKKYGDELIAFYPPAVEGAHSRQLFDNRVIIHYKFMDACDALENEHYNVDAWYLDGFSPAKNPDMWSQALFEKIAQNSHHGATCSTYTAAGFVRRNLQVAGFEVEKVSGYGKKREMLVASLGRCETVPLIYTDKPWFAPPLKHVCSDRQATVIGAGVAGLCLAYSLVNRGWKVTIIDEHGGVAKATSSNPAAIVYPRLSANNDVDTGFYTQAYCYAVHMMNRLQHNDAEKFWFGNGLLQLVDKKRISTIINRFDFNNEFVVMNESQGTDASMTVNAGDNPLARVEYKTAGVVLPELLCRALAEECGDHLTIISAKVSAIAQENTRWQCITEDGSSYESEVLVIASGVNINSFGLPITFPIESVRGQVVALKDKSSVTDIMQAVNAGIYLTPSINGKHFLGASYKRGNTDLTIDEKDTETLLAELNDIYPGIFTRKDVVDCWVGLRAMSNDRIPIAGAVPDLKFYEEHYADIKHGRKDKIYPPASYLNGLYISAAHGSRGFTSSFLCAELIAAQIQGEPCPVSNAILDYLNPSRFAVNDLKRG